MSIGSAARLISGTPNTALAIPWTRVTRATDGYVSIAETPSALASRIGATVDDLSLAACISSEVGSLPGAYLYAVGEAINNEALATGRTLTTLLTAGGVAGHYGQQSGRFAATTQHPSQRALAAARLARANAGARFTKGARRFLDLKVQDGGFQAGKPIQPSENVIRSRYNDGWKWVGPLHDPDTGEWLIDSYILFLMSRDGKYTIGDAMDELNAGRARWKSGGVVDAIAPVAKSPGALLIAGAVLAAIVEVV